MVNESLSIGAEGNDREQRTVSEAPTLLLGTCVAGFEYLLCQSL